MDGSAQLAGEPSPVKTYLRNLAKLFTDRSAVSPTERITSQEVVTQLKQMGRDFALQSEDAENPRRLLDILDTKAYGDKVAEAYDQVG